MRDHDPRNECAGHVEIDLMARLLTAHAQDEDVYQRLLPHMVGQCPECRQLLVELEELRREAAAPDALIAATEWPAAPGLWGRLAPLPFEEQLRAAAADETLHTWGLCRLLQVKSGGEAREHPAAAGRLAQLALVISEHLAKAQETAELAKELRAMPRVDRLHAAAPARPDRPSAEAPRRVRRPDRCRTRMSEELHFRRGQMVLSDGRS